MSYVDEAFKSIERIGGTFSYLENELGSKLQVLNTLKMNNEQHEMALLAKNLTLIFTFGVVQEITMFIRYNERVYVNSRTYDDLSEKGKQEMGYRLIEEMMAHARVLP